jgi:uncharacterized protein (DUF952 family)
LTAPGAFGISPAMLVYKILRRPEWADLRARGLTEGAPIDVADGFGHLSTGAQAAETAARPFAGVAELILLACDTGALGAALKWEPSRGGALFPHLYRPLLLSDVVWSRDLPLGPQGHIFPAELP